MNIDDPVRRALEALAADDESRRARPHVERAVLDAFDRQPLGRPGTIALTVQLATAALIIIGLATAMYVYTSRVPVPPRLPESGSESLATALPTSSLPPPTPEAPTTVQNRRASVARPARSTAVEAPGQAPSEAPRVLLVRDGGETFRQAVQVSVPRSYLPLLGVPIIDPDAGGMIDIEVLLGEDGQSRAIRVLP